MENTSPKKKLPAFLVLAIIALVAAVVLAVTNMVTKGPIQEHAMAALRDAFGAVMPADDYEEIAVPAGYDTVSSLYAAKTGDEVIGYCVTAVGKGYNGDVAVTLGVGTDGIVTGCSVGDTNFAETAGFGQRAREPEFQDQFAGIDAVNGGAFQALSGATVTSTAVLNATNAALVCVDEVALQKTPATTPLVAFGEKQESAAKPAAPVAGGQSAAAKGFQSDVTVTLSLDDAGAISELSIDASGETEGFGQRVPEDETFKAQFIGKTGPFTLGEGIDAVSGATVTSTAVVEAVNAALTAPASSDAGSALTATAKGFQSDVTVSVTMEGDAIASIVFDTTGETEGFGQRAMSDETFQSQFIGKTAPLTIGENIDALSGATITSTALVDATNEAMASAATAGSVAPATIIAEDENAKLGVNADGSAAIIPNGDFTGKVDASLTVEGGKVTEGTVTAALPSTASLTDRGEATATAKGFQSNVRATLTLNADDTIAELTIGSSKETEYIGQAVGTNKDFVNQFIGKTAPFTIGEGIDAVSGATVTSTAAVAAVNDAAAFAKENGVVAAAPEATEELASEAPAAEAADTLEGAGKGFASDVKVTLTVDAGGKIATMTVDASGETAGLGQKASEDAFTGQFIGKTAPFAIGENIDAISGATVTSEAVVSVVNACFPQDDPASATATDIAEDAAATTTVESEAKGFASQVKVTAELNADGTIAALTVDASGETENFGQRVPADEAFLAQFVGKAAPFAIGEGIDALSGATVTSTAVVEALNTAMAE